MSNETIYRIGLIIPCFNNADTLVRCLSSVKNIKANLRKSTIECICVDDNSTDKTIEVLRKYKKNGIIDIIFSNQENLGVSACRNIGIKSCQNTDWIAFLDADDELTPNFTLIEDYLGNEESQIIGSHIRDDGIHNNIQIHHLPYTQRISRNNCANYIQEYLIRPNHFSLFTSCWSRLYKTKTVFNRKITLFNEKMNTAEDVDFTYRILIKDPTCYYLRTDLYKNYVSINHRPSHSATFAVQRPLRDLFSFLWAIRSAKLVLAKYSDHSRQELTKKVHHCIGSYIMVYYVRSTQGITSFGSFFRRAKSMARYTKTGYLAKCLISYDATKAEGSKILAFLVASNSVFLSYLFSNYLRKRRYR